jgi:peroxisomal 3,2-trans-enoyl-CoA isomerase
MSTVSVHVSEGIATITLNRPKALNSITSEGLHYLHVTIHGTTFTHPQANRDIALDYDAFANALREIDARKEVLVTVWQGLSLSTEYTMRIFS